MASTDPGPGYQAGDTAVPSTVASTGVGAPVVRASDLLGSHRTVDTIPERDAILSTLRDEGMSVWVTGTSELWRLVGGVTNGDWILEGSVGGGTAQIRTFVVGVVLNDVVYQTGGAGLVDRADASAVASANPAGIVRALNVPGPGQCVVVPIGVDLTGFVGLTIGARYILASSPGLMVEETDTGNLNYPAYLTPGSGEVLAPVGVATSATALSVNTSAGLVAVG